MSKEYFENSRSKTSFILIGIIIAFVLIAILSSSSKRQEKMIPNYEDWYQQLQSDFEKEKDSLRDYQQQLLHQQSQNTRVENSYALSTSLNISNGKLVGSVSSSDITTLETYKKAIRKYADIVNLDGTSFSFESDDTDDFSEIYNILGYKKVAFKEIWS
jgi:hypothetical protein